MADCDTGSAGRSRPADLLLSRLRDAVYWSGVAIFVATVSALFAAIFVNVVLRYIFEQGISWAYEIPAILFPWSVAGAIVVATASGRNIQVAILAKLLPSAPRRIVGLAVQLSLILVSLGVIWTSGPILASSRFTTLSETGISQVYGVSSLIYCFAMIAVIGSVDLVRLLRGGVYMGEDEAESSFS